MQFPRIKSPRDPSCFACTLWIMQGNCRVFYFLAIAAYISNGGGM